MTAPLTTPPPSPTLAGLDRLTNRLYGDRANPLYQSGALVILLWGVLLVTGLWLLLFYRIGAPWESVDSIARSPWTGAWVRSVHRYASDAAILATLAHAARMFLQRRTWGARTVAWIAGVALLGLLVFSGLTGFVMVWDTFAARLALEGARLLDLLPLFSEPTRATFLDGRPIPGAFFFLNLFLHVAVPLGLILVLWLHLSRTARPTLLPPRALGWWIVAGLLALAVAVPVRMAPKADPFSVPAAIPTDWFYAPWLPATEWLSPSGAWAVGILAVGGLLLVPWVTRPAPTRRPLASQVDPGLCTGCRQCALDCPYDAIEMVPRHDGRAEVVAKIDPARCVSCGICAASCAPMSVGPPGRTGRDQLAAIRARIAEHGPDTGIVVFGCDQSAATARTALERAGALVVSVPCVGNLHSSTVEYAVRRGGRGVLILTCPGRDCWNREGPKWLDQRLYHDREAELKPRVERARIRVAAVPAYDAGLALAEYHEFGAALTALEPPTPVTDVAVDPTCTPPTNGRAT